MTPSHSPGEEEEEGGEEEEEVYQAQIPLGMLIYCIYSREKRANGGERFVLSFQGMQIQ